MLPDTATVNPRAFEPFRPSYTMDDLLNREEEIRQASLDIYKQKAQQSRERLSKLSKSKSKYADNEWKRINSGCLELDLPIPDF